MKSTQVGSKSDITEVSAYMNGREYETREQQLADFVNHIVAKHGFDSAIDELILTAGDLALATAGDHPHSEEKRADFAYWAGAVWDACKRHDREWPFEVESGDSTNMRKAKAAIDKALGAARIIPFRPRPSA